MIYEYCTEIQESGIDKSFPTSCGSYLEMGLNATLIGVDEVNKVFQEAGLIELDKFQNNTLTEASAKEIWDTVKGKIVEKAVAFWERIKKIWGAIQKWFEDKLNSLKNKLLKRFQEIDFKQYKKAIDKINSEINLELFPKVNKISKEIGYVKQANGERDPYGFICSEVKLGKADGLEEAKDCIDKKLGNPVKVSYNYLITNKNEIIRILGASVKDVNQSYRDAKQAMDKAIKDLKSSENSEDAKANIVSKFKLICAKENLILYCADRKNKEFIKLCTLVANVNLRCTPATKEVTKESAKFDTDFVNEVFAW